MVQKFLNQCCSEQTTLELDGPSHGELSQGSDDEPDSRKVRHVVTTSPLEDWLWRGENVV